MGAFVARKRISKWLGSLVATVFVGATGLLGAEISLGPLFSDGAVLQRDKPVPIWGHASPGDKVTVSFGGAIGMATADRDGRWLTVLDPLSATVVGADLTVATKDSTVVVHDVVVGEVWLCSGQSNMEFTVNRGMNAEQEMAGAHYPLLRQLKIERQVSAAPADRVATSGWKTATPGNVGDFTAVGYFFGRDIQQRLGVPVGLVHSSYGGTPVEAWMSSYALASKAEFDVVAERWRNLVAEYPMAEVGYETRLAAWNAGEAAAKNHGEKALSTWLQQNPKPYPPHGAIDDPWMPSGLFNGMINPLLPGAIRGVLWYQGESNTDRPAEYHDLFAAMVTAWRAHLGQGDVPFFWVNLANWRPNDPSDRGWAVLRESQTKTLNLPNTGQAITIDIGDPIDIHPKNKQEVGRRLALLAKHRVYGFMVDDTGPTLLLAVREGSAMRVRFTGTEGGLVAHAKPPQALELAGPDRVFHPATARIERDSLLVVSPQVKEPAAVRYAWRNSPEANLYNGAGLPMVPFRSDNW